MPPPVRDGATQSVLNPPAILEAAKLVGADGVAGAITKVSGVGEAAAV